MSTAPLVALISATPSAIQPAVEAISSVIPAAKIWNLLDDRLLVDAQEAGGVNRDLFDRMTRLIRYALDAGADGVLLTCSQYGAVARAVAATETQVPILGADDAAFGAVVNGGFRRVLILASLDSALSDSTERLGKFLAENSNATELIGRVVPGAAQAAGRGDTDALSVLLGEAITGVLDVDAILLAQYSLAPAHRKLASRFDIPVLAGPILSAHRLADDLGFK